MPPTSPPKVQLCAIDKKPPNEQTAIATLQDLFARKSDDMAKVTAKHLTRERLMAIAVNCVRKTPLLMECTPVSVLASVMAGAAMGLEAGGPLAEGFLIPRWNSKLGAYECSFLPGYRGLISLARRSGHVLSIEADVVYEADEWDMHKTEMGTTFRHVPSEDEKPGDVRLAYAIARLKDSPIPVIVMMPRRELESIRTREKKRGYSPWDSDYAEMCKKTSIRRICKYLPMSIEMANGLDADAEDDEREIIDVTPAPKRLRAVEPSTSKSEDAISNPPETTVDDSESQEQVETEVLADVLRGIEVLRTGDECQQLSDRLKTAAWASDEDRKTAAAALKARWKVVLAEAKAAMQSATKSETKTEAPKTADRPPETKAEPAKPGWATQNEKDNVAKTSAEATAALTRCDECGLLKGHDTKCSKNETNVDTKTIDWVKAHEDTKPLMGLKDPPPNGPRVRYSDGSWAPPPGDDEIQGRNEEGAREPGSDDD